MAAKGTQYKIKNQTKATNMRRKSDRRTQFHRDGEKELSEWVKQTEKEKIIKQDEMKEQPSPIYKIKWNVRHFCCSLYTMLFLRSRHIFSFSMTHTHIHTYLFNVHFIFCCICRAFCFANKKFSVFLVIIFQCCCCCCYYYF